MLAAGAGGRNAQRFAVQALRDAQRRILEDEDDLIAAHRWQIEETMAIVRQEMALLGQVPPVVLRILPCSSPGPS